MKKAIQNLLFIINLLVITVTTLLAQPTIGTTTFNGANVSIASFDLLPRSGPPVDGWNFSIEGSAAASGSIFHGGAATPSYVVMFGELGTTNINIASSDGSEFNLDNYSAQFFNFSGTYTITAYQGGVSIGSTTASAVAGGGYSTVDLSANTNFDNIDEIRLTGFGGSSVTLYIGEITISAAAAANTAPTASSFTAASGPFENLTYTFSTADFGYSDGDGDPLNNILIESLPGAGTLYVDANGNDTFDGGEQLSAFSTVSKANLDAGNLQYIQNGSINTSFQFEVNDGTENSSGNYVATLNVVPVPTVTLGLSPISRNESISTNNTITATLSNAYGTNTTVSLAFSGTATNSVDYNRSGTSILVSAGSTTGTITLSNINDALYEGNETVVIDISGVSNGTEDGTQQVTYTITDDDPQPNASLEILPEYNPITSESGGQAYVRGKLSATAGTTVTIPLSFSGTATGGGTDYSITSSSITLSPGELMDSMRVTSLFDGIEEGDETIIIDMGTPTNATESGTQQVTLTIEDEDAAPPSGYSVTFDQSPINAGNEGSASFTFAGAEVGATYNYTFSSSGGGTNVTGSGTITTATDQISGIDLSGLGDGTITLSVTLTDTFSNTGSPATDTETKDTTAPSGYSVSIDQAGINLSNEGSASFTFAGAEVGATYNYTFSSSGGGTNVTGSGTITTATDQISGIDLSGLGDGTITLSVTLSDGAGNTGSAATDTETKDTSVPTGYSVAIDQSPINVSNEGSVSFTFAGAEVGTTYNYTFSSSGGGTNVTGSGTITTATDQITSIDISGLGDGTITLSATLTDGGGNTGSAATDTETKDATVPTGYSVSIDQAFVNIANETAISFTFAGAEVGATYNYTFSSSGGGTNVTGSSTITTSTDQITGIDLSGLGDGTITLSVTLTDANSNTGSAATDTKTKDTSAPNGYTATIDQSPVNLGNESAVSFTFGGAEVGTTYNYTFSSSGGGTNVTGSGTTATATDKITGIDLSGLADGTITLSVTLTDAVNNTGVAATDTETKETVPPSGYSVTIDQSPINAGNETAVSFRFAAAEVGTTYDYTFSSSGGGTNVTGSGTITTANDQISAIDLSGLGDGAITLSVTLTDGNGNTGSAATDTETKDTGAPTGYTVTFDQAAANAGNETAISFTFASAEVGATYNYSISSSGGGTNATGSGTIATTTDQISGIDVSGLGDGTLTLSVTLTDVAGNTGTATTDNIQKDIGIPAGYSVSIDLLGESFINVINESIIEFSGSGLEVGTTLNYSFSSDGGGTPVTGTETVTSISETFDNSGAGYDLSGLTDGTVTLTISLTDDAGNTGVDATATASKDAGPPTGYTVSWDEALINTAGASTASFTVSNAEIGTTINNSISSSGDGNTATVSNPITVTSTNQVVTIDVSSLVDGQLTVEVTLTDAGGNTGGTVSDNSTTLDQTAASGYSVSIDQTDISAANHTVASFTFAGAEVGATYNYTFSSSADGTDVTGSGTIASATDQISGIDISGLGDGTITLSVTLTDPAGNEGSAATDNVSKDATAPNFISVDDDGGDNSYKSGESLSIIADLGETGLTVTADLSVINSGLGATAAMTDNTDGTYSITVADVDTGGNMIEGTSIAVPLVATDGAGNQQTDNSLTLTFDKTAPAGYTVSVDQSILNATNQAAMSFTFGGAEVGATYNYSITSDGGGTAVTGNGTIASATDQITGVDVSGLGDGNLTLSVTLTDAAGNTGAAATDNIQKDVVVPSGYSVSMDLLGESFINAVNENIIEFAGSGLEVGTTLNYSFNSDGGGTPVTGTEIVSSTSETFDNSGAGYDLSGLNDGTVTLTISLTDDAGNTGSDATATASKDANPPSGYSVAWDNTFINASEASTATFTVSNAEIGATINNTVSSSGDGNTATVSNPITVTSTNQVVTIDVSSLVDGQLTVEVTLTDAGGNTGGTVSDNSTTLDQTAPSGYSVSIDQTDISAANHTVASFTFAGAELGATYNYTFSSSADGTDVTGSGTIASATDQISGIDISGLGDGTITLSVTLTDPAGNEGSAATDNVSKDATAPNFISVDDDGGDNSYKSGESLSIIADLGETGLTVTADLSVINSGLGATAAMTDNTDGTYSITVADVDNGGNMIEGTSIAVPLVATDGAGNQQTDNSLTLRLDKTAPAGYTVSVDQSILNATNQAAMSFTFGGAEVGATYNYSITSDGGGTAVTGNGTIASATDQITGVDVSGLGDGNLTLSVTLTDVVGNEGSAVTNDVTKVTTSIAFNTTDRNGDESVANASIQVDLSINSAFDVSVDYTISGTANGGGSDYSLANGTLTIPSGNESGSIDITGIVDDELIEGDETIILTLSNPTNASLGTNTEFIYIINDNDEAEISVVATSQAEEDDVDGLYTVSTSKQFANDVALTFTISGTATEGADIESLGTSVIFPASTNSINIPVVVIADTEVEEDETVILTLESTDNAAVLIGAENLATVTITDNDERLPQTITFDPIADKKLSDGEVILEATGGDSGEPITYTISTETVTGVATLSNGVITLEGVGAVTVTASQAGNNSYLPAEDVSQSFSILSDELLLPTLFTPNDDRINDVLLIRGDAAVQSVSFRIYNRKGNLVFESDSFKELKEVGWDGMKNGVNQPAGTYVWVISGTMTNGEPIRVNGSNRGTILIAR